MIRIVTFNIRCCYDTFDGINSFVHRAGLVFDKIDAEKPDVICFQEVLPAHASLLRRSLKDYTVIYNGRLEDFDGEGLCIAVRDGTELMSHDFFWLSPTPNTPASRFPEDQSPCPRIATATMLRKDGKPFSVYNAHLDHIGVVARERGAKTLVERVKSDIKDRPFPVFIMGDFNDYPDSKCLREFSSYVDLTRKLTQTFHGFGRITDDYKIDYIFTDPNTAPRCTEGVIWNECVNGIYLSDHYPVSVDADI